MKTNPTAPHTARLTLSCHVSNLSRSTLFALPSLILVFVLDVISVSSTLSPRQLCPFCSVLPYPTATYMKFQAVHSSIMLLKVCINALPLCSDNIQN